MLAVVEAEVAMVPIQPASYLQLPLFQIHRIPKLQIQILNFKQGEIGVWRWMGTGHWAGVGFLWFLGTWPATADTHVNQPNPNKKLTLLLREPPNSNMKYLELECEG